MCIVSLDYTSHPQTEWIRSESDSYAGFLRVRDMQTHKFNRLQHSQHLQPPVHCEQCLKDCWHKKDENIFIW